MKLTDRFRDYVSGGALSMAQDALREARGAAWHNEHLREKTTILEAERDSWQVMGAALSGNWNGLNDGALKKARSLAHAMYHCNVWINRGVNCQTDFVFGQGVSVSSKIDPVNEVLQDFWDDYSNQVELTLPDSLQDKERELQITGELFFAFYTNTVTARVQVRTLHPDQVIGDPICNPNDDKEPWFYKRQYSEPTFDAATGRVSSTTKTVFHPDWRYNPSAKPTSMGGVPIIWDAPVYHVRVGSLKCNKRGVPEVMAQMEWAKVYTEFLSNRATVARALSRFVTKIRTATKKAAAVAASKMAAAIGRPGIERVDDVGGTTIQGPDGDMEPMNVKGATIDPKEGSAFIDAIACGFGLPSTYFGNVDVGNHATAASLNGPVRVMFDRRRTLWTGVLTAILTYVLLQAAIRPKGKLRGKAKVVWFATTPKVMVRDAKNKEVPAPIEVDFQPYYSDEPKAQLEAINLAKPNIPDEKLICKLSLIALGQNDVDELMDGMKFPDPSQAPTPPAPPTPPTIDPEVLPQDA